MTPKVAIGLTIFNGKAYLEAALQSILSQSYREFVLFVFDDGSSDNSSAIVRGIAAHDPRVRVSRSETRRGACSAWREVFDQAAASGAQYFAWAADHDLYDRDWLMYLVTALDSNASCVLAFSRVERIDAEGLPLAQVDAVDSIYGKHSLHRLLMQIRLGKCYGNMIYGLFRLDAVRCVGGYPNLLLPDTVLIWLITVQGDIIYIQSSVWFRRFANLFSVRRQRRTLFVQEEWFHFLPYFIVNALYISVFRMRSLSGDNMVKTRGLLCCFAVGYFLKFAYVELRRVVGSMRVVPGRCSRAS